MSQYVFLTSAQSLARAPKCGMQTIQQRHGMYQEKCLGDDIGHHQNALSYRNTENSDRQTTQLQARVYIYAMRAQVRRI